jgi:hypothetical protein
VLARSAGAVANALDKLTAFGTAELATDRPRSYRLAPAAPDAAGGSDRPPGRRGTTAEPADADWTVSPAWPGPGTVAGSGMSSSPARIPGQRRSRPGRPA